MVRRINESGNIKDRVGGLTAGIDFKHTNPNEVKRIVNKRLNNLIYELQDEFGFSDKQAEDFVKSLRPTVDKFIKDITEVETNRRRALSGTTNLKSEIQQWYLDTYSDDELGWEIDPYATFEDLLDALDDGKDIYNMCADDSVVRERVFEKLAEILKVDYDVIYDKWMKNYR